jgi:hypothetical protein
MRLRAVIDNMIFDRIAAEPGLRKRLQTLTLAGKLQLLVTSQQEAECRASGNPELIAVLEEVPVTVIGSAPFVVGVSLVDIDRVGPAALYDALRAFASSPRHINDHLGVATAQQEMLPFVTEEKRLHGFAAEQAGVTIWNWSELRARIEAL